MWRGYASPAFILRRSAASWLGPRSAASASPPWMPALSSAPSKVPSLLLAALPSQSWPHAISVLLRHRSNRSRRGLYDGKDVRFGNRVSFSNKKTRRKWNPNVQIKRIYSETLDEMIKFHVTTAALRSIDKMGGLDNYLLRSKHVSTKGMGEGQRTRNRIVQKMKHREQLKKQAIARAESVEDWDKIVLVGQKIKQPSPLAEMEDS